MLDFVPHPPPSCPLKKKNTDLSAGTFLSTNQAISGEFITVCLLNKVKIQSFFSFFKH